MENKYPSFKNSLFLVFIWFIITILLAVIFQLKIFKSFNINSSLQIILINTISFGIAIFIGYKKSNLKWNQIFSTKMPDPIILFSLTIFSIGTIIISSEIENIFRYFINVPEFFYELTNDLNDSRFMVYAFIAISIVAPITEELMFRGIILRGFLLNYSKIKSVILTAFLFAFIHLNPLQFFGAFLFGIFAAIIILNTKNLLLTIYFHSLFNFLPWSISNFTNIKIKGFNDISDPSEIMKSKNFQPIWFDFAGIILIFIGVFIFRKKILLLDKPKL